MTYNDLGKPSTSLFIMSGVVQVAKHPEILLGPELLPETMAEETGAVMSEAVEANFKRFLGKIPANSKASATFGQTQDGTWVFEAISPGKVPGSNALYQKFVSPLGNTIKLEKITFDPFGEIVHLKVK